jgi:hypothetical protein
MFTERRRKRSSFSGLALQYWLSSLAQRKQLFALVLADSAGLLIGSNLHGPEAEELAAVAPLLARPAEDKDSALERRKIPMVIDRMQIDRSSLYLCAVGDERRSRECLRLAATGIRRILA